MVDAMANSSLRIVDGSADWSQGVSSGKSPNIASAANPNGLKRNQIAWATSAAVRGGGITNRPGFQPLVQGAPWSGLYQGEFMYEPTGGNPYIIASIGGRIYQIHVDTDNSVVDLSAVFGLTNPPDIPQAFFVQGEEFLVIQAGDYVTNPLFWDGTTLRRSDGLSSATIAAVPGIACVPNAAGQITIINISDTTHVGQAGVTGQSASGSGWSLTNIDSFVMPAVGASATVNVGTISGTFPQYLRLFLLGNIFSGTLQVTLCAFGTGTPDVAAVTSQNGIELPPAGPMDYYMGRIWYAFGRTFCAGDIVKGPSGTAGAPYFKRDSILKVTESPVGAAGDGFVLPTNAGNIRAITHTQELDTATGEGRLYIGTRKAVYRLAVPVTRADWIATDNDSKQPFQTVALMNSGPVSDRCMVKVNGDLFFQTLVPSIVSFALSIRNFGEWGNTAISRNLNRVMKQMDRALLHVSSGIEFNDRVLITALPFQTSVGIAHKGILPLDLDIITSLEEKLPPAWEGMWEGLDVLQLAEGDFGGLQRAFATVVSRVDGTIQVWEITQGNLRDNGDNRISFAFETPAFDWSVAGSSAFRLKELETLELWIDKISGSCEAQLFYRPDQFPCWLPYHAWKFCESRNCSENMDAVSCAEYPEQAWCEGFRSSFTMPKPPVSCISDSGRPSTQGYVFQFKLVIKGSCRVRGILAHALPVDKAPFHGLTVVC